MSLASFISTLIPLLGVRDILGVRFRDIITKNEKETEIKEGNISVALNFFKF